MRFGSTLIIGLLAATPALAGSTLSSVLTPLDAAEEDNVVVLKNDAFQDNGGQAYLQMGFVANEKAGVWVKVPDNIPLFKVDYFRILIGNSQNAADLTPSELNAQIFFQMGVAAEASIGMPADIENAAQVTAGPYWNDVPAQGETGTLRCARGGEVIGAAIEFTHTGLPSIYRDLDGLANAKYNTLYAIPGGWNYSVAYGLRGDWILRVVGHEAKAGECE